MSSTIDRLIVNSPHDDPVHYRSYGSQKGCLSADALRKGGKDLKITYESNSRPYTRLY